MADGILVSQKLHTKENRNDSISFYNSILIKNNVDRKIFERTVEYYTEHTPEYRIIYGKVLKRILKEEISVNKTDDTVRHISTDENLWTQKFNWSLPEDGAENAIPYKYELDLHGTYTVSADILMYADDQTMSKRMTIMANYEDGTRDRQTNSGMKKDGKFHSFEVSIVTNKKKKLKSISGWILDHGKGTKEKHSEVSNIELKYKK